MMQEIRLQARAPAFTAGSILRLLDFSLATLFIYNIRI